MTIEEEVEKIQDCMAFIFSLQKKYYLEPYLVLNCKRSCCQLDGIEHDLLVKIGKSLS
mgnify:FL=1